MTGGTDTLPPRRVGARGSGAPAGCPPGCASARLRGTPAGDVEVITSRDGLWGVRFLRPGEPGSACLDVPDPAAAHHLDRTLGFLGGLLDAGSPDDPAPVLDLAGIPHFARLVYRALLGVPAGEVVSYGDLARAVGSPGAARAVGRAVGANPVPLVVPCHRVIRSDGRLGGFGGGLELKAALLRLEGVRVEGHDPGSRVGAPGAARA